MSPTELLRYPVGIELAQPGHLSYNLTTMLLSRRVRQWIVLGLALALIVALGLWVGRMVLQDGHPELSPPVSPLAVASPLSTPIATPGGPAPPAAWTGVGAALLWVALGTLLGLGLVLFIMHRGRQVTE